MFSLSKWLTGSTVVGFLLWLTLLRRWSQQPPDLMATVFLLLLWAILVNTPLALRLLPPNELSLIGYRWAIRLQPVAAWGVVATVFVTPKTLSADPLPSFGIGLLTVPWLLFAVLLALSAVWQLSRWRQLTVSISVRLAACAFLPIGAAWLVAFRLGLHPLGFSGIIVLLTAVHFHFTGFAATIWVSMIGEQLSAAKRAYRWFAGGFILATPLIALGITLSPLLELIGVLLLATTLLGLTTLLYRHVLPTVTAAMAKGLLALAPVAMAAALALAVTYGIGEYQQAPLLTIPQMVQWHGWLNAIGFTFLGLLGWRVAQR